jgi:hypothetical protein
MYFVMLDVVDSEKKEKERRMEKTTEGERKKSSRVGRKGEVLCRLFRHRFKRKGYK